MNTQPILTPDMKRVVTEQRLGFVATVCRDGTPNLSPKGTTTVWDDEHLVFADIRSPRTVQNLSENAVAEVNVVDPIRRKGFRFKGRATLHRDGPAYERGLAILAMVRRWSTFSPSTLNVVALSKKASLRPHLPHTPQGRSRASVQPSDGFFQLVQGDCESLRGAKIRVLPASR